MRSSIKPKSFIRWAGSKRQLVPLLSSCWPGDDYRYIEPFMGSACVFFSISPPRALLSDLNAELIGMFESVRQAPEAVYSSLLSIPMGAESYYTIRKMDPNLLIPTDRAARFLFLNRFCFNGLYRTNLKGEFNVPFASSRTGGYPSWDEFSLASNRLKNVDIRCGDFASILASEVKDGDFVYLDPPYAVQNTRIFSQYGPQTFGLNDLERLRETLIKIDSSGALFLLSYADCDEAKHFFRDWPTTNVEVQRNIAGFAKHRRRAAEILVSNFDCESLAEQRNA
jgi:DNA adenine methylase